MVEEGGGGNLKNVYKLMDRMDRRNRKTKRQCMYLEEKLKFSHSLFYGPYSILIINFI